MAARFATTQWSRVLAARDGVGTEAEDAMAFLCEKYWLPLFAFIRRQGSDPDEAADLTQAYFCYLLEKDVLHNVRPSAGRFRSFLLASLRHFLSHQREKAKAQKRGGGRPQLSLDAAAAEARYELEPVESLTPEQVFEQRWALTVLERSLARLAEELDGKTAKRFDRLRPFLTGRKPSPTYAQVASDLETTEGAIRASIYRLRRQLGELLREEIAETVCSLEDVDDEIRHLLAVFGPTVSPQSR